MKFVTVRRWLMASVCSTFTLFMTGCVTFAPAAQSQVKQLEERPYLAVLPVTFDLAITRLSDVKTVDGTLAGDEERHLADAVQQVKSDSRWLFLSRLAAGGGFRFVSPEEVDRVAEELHLPHGAADFRIVHHGFLIRLAC